MKNCVRSEFGKLENKSSLNVNVAIMKPIHIFYTTSVIGCANIDTIIVIVAYMLSFIEIMMLMQHFFLQEFTNYLKY